MKEITKEQKESKHYKEIKYALLEAILIDKGVLHPIEDMRDATPEEQAYIQSKIEEISVPTGVNFYDYLKETNNEKNCKI